MSVPFYTDLYFQMKHPSAIKDKSDQHERAMKEFFIERGVITNEQREHWVKDAIQYWSDRRAYEIESADKRILEIFGVTVDDLNDMKKDKKSKQAGGRTPNYASSEMGVVFNSFIVSEGKGHTFAEAINEARCVVDTYPTEKTLRTWLKNLIRLGVCDIPAPTRRKKNGNS